VQATAGSDNVTVMLWRVDGLNRRVGDPITKSVAELELPDDLLQFMILAHHSEDARAIVDSLQADLFSSAQTRRLEQAQQREYPESRPEPDEPAISGSLVCVGA